MHTVDENRGAVSELAESNLPFIDWTSGLATKCKDIVVPHHTVLKVSSSWLLPFWQSSAQHKYKYCDVIGLQTDYTRGAIIESKLKLN